MNDLLKKFLTGIGIDTVTITTLSADPETYKDKPPDVDSFITSFKENQRKVAENDHEFMNKIRNDIMGKERGTIEHAAKQIFELTSEQMTEVEKASPGAAKYKAILQFGKENAGKSKDKTLQELQSEIQQKNIEIQKYKDEIIPQIKSEAQAEVKRDKLSLYISNMAFEDKRLLMKRPVFNTNLEMQINRKYDADTDEQGRPVLKIKGKGTLPQNKEGTRNLTIDEIIEQEAIEMGVFAESNAGEEPGKKTPPSPTPENDGKYRSVLPGMAAAEANVEKLKSEMIKNSLK